MILAGAWTGAQYEKACARAFTELGVKVIPFIFNRYFYGFMGKAEAYTMLYLSRQKRLNADLYQLCVAEKPDILFTWKGIYLDKKTLNKIRSLGVLLVSYNNDDPFSNQYAISSNLNQRNIWKRFIRSLPSYDINFAYRAKNIEEYKNAGARNVYLFPSYYVPELTFPLHKTRGEAFEGVYIGHYENDERLDCITALIRAGIRVKVFGSGWQYCKDPVRNILGDIYPVTNEDYNITLNKATFALCFFSKLNRDTYTRRVFEIPSTQTVLVSRRTADMQSLYIEDQEAIYFDDSDELVAKMTFLCANKSRMNAVAQNGYLRAKTSGYDVKSRIEEVMGLMYPYLKGMRPTQNTSLDKR